MPSINCPAANAPHTHSTPPKVVNCITATSVASNRPMTMPRLRDARRRTAHPRLRLRHAPASVRRRAPQGLRPGRGGPHQRAVRAQRLHARRRRLPPRAIPRSGSRRTGRSATRPRATRTSSRWASPSRRRTPSPRRARRSTHGGDAVPPAHRHALGHHGKGGGQLHRRHDPPRRDRSDPRSLDGAGRRVRRVSRREHVERHRGGDDDVPHRARLREVPRTLAATWATPPARLAWPATGSSSSCITRSSTRPRRARCGGSSRS